MKKLRDFLLRVPGITWVSTSKGRTKEWWVKLGIDIEHPLAWRVVQELGFVLNYISVNERLPTRFYPVSPPPYLNGGPKEFLSWVIEPTDPSMSPTRVAEWLEGRLPRPVKDHAQWQTD